MVGLVIHQQMLDYDKVLVSIFSILEILEFLGLLIFCFRQSMMMLMSNE
jgi:hypothetical protein